MSHSDLSQILRETLGLVFMIAGLVATTYFLFAL